MHLSRRDRRGLMNSAMSLRLERESLAERLDSSKGESQSVSNQAKAEQEDQPGVAGMRPLSREQMELA
jgi:hypothetical protein